MPPCRWQRECPKVLSQPAASSSVSARCTQGKKRRIVVTGMGLVSCLGHEVDEFYDNLLQGKSGITPIEVRGRHSALSSCNCKKWPPGQGSALRLARFEWRVC